VADKHSEQSTAIFLGIETGTIRCPGERLRSIDAPRPSRPGLTSGLPGVTGGHLTREAANWAALPFLGQISQIRLENLLCLLEQCEKVD
jgi:hypothetical protein